jgi:hypothetical protein
VRVGDTVRRLAGWWTPAVHHLLAHLHDIGFPYAPRPLGIDDESRDVLSFIAGESGRACRLRVIPDAGLAAYARLLRAYHDAVADYRPPPDADWAVGRLRLADGEVICHGDFGSWNLVWRGAEPVGIVDWDLAYPGPALDDVAYALVYSVPFRDDATAIAHFGFTEPPRRRHRLTTFAEAYGVDTAGLVDAVIARQWKYAAHLGVLHDRGLDAPWATTGSIHQAEQAAAWTEANRGLFA